MASAVPTPTTMAPEIALTDTISRVLPAILAMFLGAFIIGVAGFSQMAAVHDAAHDTRHSNGFPCH